MNALNEVRILASLKSSFVISYKEAFFDETDSTLGIVMEYADKTDLYQKIVEHKKAAMFFDESDIWRILIQLVKGLKALHELKILHRDLKVYQSYDNVSLQMCFYFLMGMRNWVI